MRTMEELSTLRDKQDIERKALFIEKYGTTIKEVEEAYIKGKRFMPLPEWDLKEKEEFLTMFEDFHSLNLRENHHELGYTTYLII